MPRKKKEESSAPTPKPKRATKTKAVKPPAAKTAKAPKAPKTAKSAALKSTAPKTKAAAPLSRARKALSLAKPIPSGRFPRQGETRMIAFIRDPLCIFTYWEVTPETVDGVKKDLMEEFKGSSMVLRVFRTGPDGRVDLMREIRVEPGEMNRYVELPSEGGVFFLEIVQKSKSGRVVAYVRSNTVMIGPAAAWAMASLSTSPAPEPPDGLKEYFAEEWDPEGAALPSRGLSSAETQARSRSKYAASHIG